MPHTCLRAPAVAGFMGLLLTVVAHGAAPPADTPRAYDAAEREMLRLTNAAADARTGWRKMETFEITANDIRRSGRNFDWWNPLWHERSYAASTRYGDIIAPPFFLSALAGAGLDMVVVPGVGRWSGANDGGMWELYRPLEPGDVVRVWQERPAITDVTAGNGPRSFHIDTTWVFVNQHNERVAAFTSFLTNSFATTAGGSSGSNAAGTGAPGGPGGAGPGAGGPPPGGASPPPGAPPGGGGPPWLVGRERIKYSAEDWKHIDALAHQEVIRGAKIRYWEDVSVGEETAPVIAEPTTVLDMIKVGGDIVMTIPPLREMPRELGKELSQDECGVYHNLVEGHFTPLNSATSMHFMAFGENVMARLVTNWMGDDGWMRRFDASHRSADVRIKRSKLLASKQIVGGHGVGGDAVIAHAEVVKKYVEGSEHLVELVVWTESLRGQVWQTATATVKLLSREDPAAWQ
jgi:acyl dehydratase